MSALTDKISEYIRISSEISSLENGFSIKKQELERKYLADYTNLKKGLAGYISRIKPTVDIVCNLYKSTLSISNNKIRLGGELPMCDFTPLNACEIAVKSGNESFGFLSAVIKKVNVSSNLREFIKRYNTIIEILSSADVLRSRAVSTEMANYQSGIASLKAELQTICRDKEEFDLLVSEMNKSNDEMYRRVFIQDTKEMESKLVTEIALPVGYESCAIDGILENGKNEILVSTLDWNLHKDGIFVIRADNEDIDNRILSICTINTITQFLFSYPTFSKKIMLCDSRSSSTITSFAGILKSENNNLFFDNENDSYVKNSDEDIRESLSELNRIINYRLLNNIGPSSCKDVLSFNSKNPDNPLPLILVLLNGYPYRYEGASDDLVGILRNGREAGVYVLLVENTLEDEESRYIRNRLPDTTDVTDNIANYIVDGKTSYLSKNGKKYYADTRGECYDVGGLLSMFNESKNGNAKQIMYLDSILPDEDYASSPRRIEYSKTLTMPIGKQGSKIVDIPLDAGSPFAHLAIVGSSGAGKTAFLNTLILSMCNMYSPDELELHMILMAKDDFLVFKKHNLPHLKTIVTGDQVSRANDVLDFLEDEMSRRRSLIGTDGNIYEYNSKAKDPLPRCVIIIDEFYELVENNRDAIATLTDFAFLGRAFGISLIISSIRFPIDVKPIIPQFGNRIEFLSKENAGNLIPGVEYRQTELGKGLCFFEHDNNLRLVTIAFSEEGDALGDRIRAISRKYPGHRMNLQNIVSPTRISNEDDVPFIVKRDEDVHSAKQIAIKNYMKDWNIRVRLGKRDLFNTPLEYTFNNDNNVLFLFGRYPDTKLMEASLIKDTLVLSRDVDAPTVYYLDCNQNVHYRDMSTVVKRMQGHWALKMVYCPDGDTDTVFKDISDLIETRIKDRNAPLYPVLVVITQSDEMLKDMRKCDKLCDLISRGKNALINFVIQCDKPIRFRSSDEYMTDAIIFPGSTDDEYSDPSEPIRSALERMPAASGPKGKTLLTKIAKHGLDPRLHVLCNKNKVFIFLPYEYDEEYLKNIVDIGDLL